MIPRKTAKAAFHDLWRRSSSIDWEVKPWVWVVQFKLIEFLRRIYPESYKRNDIAAESDADQEIAV
ncbi:hypothetical protein FUT69_10225 [Xylella taiwanensis]|uniref:Uncharacterized protein n=1 Tax=Xylella taiwanensis TaxID=1444770 RepID=Z9JL26_9GAMM|nr:hypothetical protein [Xylella taiwanensis]AXI82907.1 hypothetical protein AB672_02530 [Xylella taiwanensis]EWS78472.1 hypothetical protein AF72_05205 [Xylella taiwanensis]MCD8455926.1 hypothetical protein [Xylella taiwanensis]MCD8458329.1 hypothetical protein [Xylella taiwanensis]MCD8460468.1 hypothetical protein [Xylella taiwanensis]